MQLHARRPIGRTGLTVTTLGFGGASVGNLHGAVPETQAYDAIAAAYAASVRYFDTAPLYGAGLGERRVGAALTGCPREGLVVSTKVGHLLSPAPGDATATDRLPNTVRFDYSYDATMRCIEGSLQRLRLDAVDMAFIHDIDPYNHGDAQPDVFQAAMDGAWRALMTLREQGMLGAAGIGVNNVAVCEAALAEADLDCILLAGRYTLLDAAALSGLLPSCTDRHVSIIVGAPFNSGLLACGAQSDARYNYAPPPDLIRQRVAAIEHVASRHGITIMAAALQFPLGHPAVASVLPGMRSAAQVQTCVSAINERIPADFWAELRADGLIDPAAPVPAGERA